MSTGVGLFLLGVWIAFAANILSGTFRPNEYARINRLTLLITVLTLICVLLANLYRL